jgi:hypothetical protein
MTESWSHLRHAIVHDEQTGLDKPDGQDLHLLNDENQFRAVDATMNFDLIVLVHVFVGRDEIAASHNNLVHDNHKDGIGHLCRESASARFDALWLQYHGQQDQVVVELQAFPCSTMYSS